MYIYKVNRVKNTALYEKHIIIFFLQEVEI